MPFGAPPFSSGARGGDRGRVGAGKRDTRGENGSPRHIDPGGRGRCDSGGFAVREGHILRLAGRQRGLITRRQLLACGLSSSAIDWRLESGRLHGVHPGVYAVGHGVLAPWGRELAALLACGPGSGLCLLDAAVVWELAAADPQQPVHVTVTGSHRRGASGIVVHRARHVELTRRHGLPVTTPRQTLLDLAAAGHPALPRALNEAQVCKLVSLDALLTFARGRPGARALGELITDAPGYTRSQAEIRLRALIRRAGLPRPQTNARAGRYEIDALWPDHRLAVEVDGYATHSTRRAFERDRIRDADLQAAGYRILRITWDQLTRHPEAVAARLATALAAAPRP